MRELYPYQRAALEKANANPEGGALFLEPGLGKTLTTIRAAQEAGVTRMVVVCPVSAISVWEDELQEEGFNAFVPEGSGVRKAKAVREFTTGPWDSDTGRWAIIVNYEALLNRKLEDALRRSLIHHAGGDREGAEYAAAVLDESHYIKNPTAKRSRAVHRLVSGIRTYVLTGTPISQGHHDLYSQAKAITPEIWDGITWTEWKNRYVRYGGFENRQIVGYRNVGDIKRRIRGYSFAATKRRVLPDLPERSDQNIRVRANRTFLKAYATLRDTGVDAARGWVTSNPLELALRLQQLSGEAKLPATIETVESIIATGAKCVVFYRFREEGRRLSEHFGSQAVEINGDVSAQKRREYIDLFQQEGSECRLFIGQLSATSTAVTLTAASDVVFHSLTWSHTEHTQARDRVYRIGQKNAVSYRYMTLSVQGRSIDELILTALDGKRDLAAEIAEDPSILYE